MECCLRGARLEEFPPNDHELLLGTTIDWMTYHYLFEAVPLSTVTSTHVSDHVNVMAQILRGYNGQKDKQLHSRAKF